MSPGVLQTESSASFKVEPLPRTEEQKFNFGVSVTGLDLNNISDAEVEELKKCIWTHKVVIVKNQHDLDPVKHWELVTRFDPDAPQVHSHGDIKSFNDKGGILSKRRQVIGIPSAPNVRLIGKGAQPPNHHGLPADLVIDHPLSHDWHAAPLADAAFQAGHTRFQRWHMDAPLYDRDPAWFTTLRAVVLPDQRARVSVHWDDGSGHVLDDVPPGRTAFLSNVQLYEELMSEEERAMADCSWVEYAPFPYLWIENCRGNANGLGLATEGREHSMEELGEWDEGKVKRYPMVWVNPVTGEKAFQVHGIAARKLFIRHSATDTPEVIDDVVKIRELLSNIQSRILKPEFILLPPVEKGDVIMWDNYNLFHTAIDYPLKYGPRTMHQANIGASRGPVGPVPISLVVA